MICRECGRPMLVRDSRRASLSNDLGAKPTPTIWRRRVCSNGHTRETVEVPVGATLRRRLAISWPVAKEADNA